MVCAYNFTCNANKSIKKDLFANKRDKSNYNIAYCDVTKILECYCVKLLELIGAPFYKQENILTRNSSKITPLQ